MGVSTNAANPTVPKAADQSAAPSGYQRTEVGMIPADWDVKQLGEIGKALIGLTYAPNNVRSHGTLVLRSSNIQNDSLAFEDNVFVEMDIPEYIMVRSGDVLICARNGSRALIGKTAFLDDRTEGMTFGAFMAVFRSKDGRFVNYLFQSNIIKRQIDAHLGATINQITNKSLNSFFIPVPRTSDERNSIAEALSDVDGLIRALEKLIAKKRAIKQAAMQQLLTGKTRLPGFTGEWETKTIDEMFSMWLASSKSRYITDGGQFLIVDMGSIDRDGRLIASKPTDYRGDFLQLGDLVMPKDDIGGGNIIGKVAFIDADDHFVLGDHVYALRLREGNSKFFAYLINRFETNRSLRSKVVGSAQLGLPRKAVLEESLPVPQPAEQDAIAAVLSDMDREIESLEQRRDKTQQIKQGMMQQLLTGRVRLVETGEAVS